MPPARPVKVEFYYDITSADTYIAFVTLLRYQQAWNISLDLIPFSLPKILDAVGAKNWPTVPIKAAYLAHDMTRTAQRWGLDIRPHPGYPLRSDPSQSVVAFLRILRQVESADVLTKCTQLLFEEYHSFHTPITSDRFFECLVQTSSTPRRGGPLTKTRMQEILARSKTPESTKGVEQDVKDVVAKYGTFSTPWMVAHKVSVDDRSPEEQAKNPIGSTEFSHFHGFERLPAMAYYLGPEYVWRGPWPDGRERFRPRDISSPGIPVENAKDQIILSSRL